MGVGDIVVSESALRSAGTLLSRVRVSPPAPWHDGAPKSFRPLLYNKSNCGTKVTSILTLMVSSDLYNKRLACLSYNRTYIEGFDITDISELFVVSVPNIDKAPDFHVSVKALVWIAVALIVFVLAQQVTNATSSRTGEEDEQIDTVLQLSSEASRSSVTQAAV
ncbi:hypothetical protein PoB_003090900 [Plakobranchus ocellatus]|uniref:Uncharacterized protein n=1 Tax=Plakobranchus ocellatus TaxID=259542 RepID=A0AAV4ADC5_9GAST|nr:hypothetical protein PoB_003090900 [Plakobranchus ocellatus]